MHGLCANLIAIDNAMDKIVDFSTDTIIQEPTDETEKYVYYVRRREGIKNIAVFLGARILGTVRGLRNLKRMSGGDIELLKKAMILIKKAPNFDIANSAIADLYQVFSQVLCQIELPVQVFEYLQDKEEYKKKGMIATKVEE